MTNSKSTKRALFGSCISLLLCFTMLLGTTFAWFTDSAVSANNVITAGNLDIDVQYTLNGTEWKPLDGADDLFQKGLWEPGHTEVVALKITNNGSLALKYSANMNIVSEKIGTNKDGGDIKLSDILTVSTFVLGPFEPDWFGDMMASSAISGVFKDGIDEPIKTVAFKEANILYEGKDEGNSICHMDAGQTAYVFVQVDMAETVGNEANAKNKNSAPSITFGINVLATQTTYEKDSFGDQYDKDAEYLIERDVTLDGDSTESVKVEANESVDFDLNNKTLNSNIVNNGAININDGTIDTTVEDIPAKGLAGLENHGKATLTDVTMDAGSPAHYSNICYAGSETTYNDVIINSEGGGIGAVDGAEVVFNSGSVAVNSASTSGRYNFYAEGEGTVITINGGTFSFSSTLNQKRAYIYACPGTTVYVNGGTFGKASTRDGYTAGIMGNGTVIITGGTFGFDPSNWVANGYTAVKSGNTWTVTAK